MDSSIASLPASAPKTHRWSDTLTSEELQRLTYFKWQYTLHHKGFLKEEQDRLMFLKWRYRTGDLTD